MRTTVTIDDELLATAKSYAKLDETSAIIREALTTYVQLEAARRLARLGGTEPQFQAPPRRRFGKS
ncbi:MAG TPA: type II toxin-antitoxin system VapB family antitoxin [Rhizomicrobium sp.]